MFEYYFDKLNCVKDEDTLERFIEHLSTKIDPSEIGPLIKAAEKKQSELMEEKFRKDIQQTEKRLGKRY